MTTIPLKARLRSSAAIFARSEDGSATIWNLLWLSIFVVTAGLSIDSTNARRVETMLVSTADVASNAAVMELPPLYLKKAYAAGSYGDAEDAALDFSSQNMKIDNTQHGDYIERDDILVGNWDKTTRQFTEGGNPVNSVRVLVGRNSDRENAVSTSMLRLIGFDNWDINAASTSLMQISACLKDGLIARESVDLASNLTVHAGMCIHGQNMVEVQNNVAWHPSTTVTHGEDAFRKIQEGQYNLMTGQHVVLPVITHNMEPAMVDIIPTIAQGMMAGDSDYMHFAQTPMVAPNPTTVVKITTTTLSGSSSYVAEGPGGVRHAALEPARPAPAVGGLVSGTGVPTPTAASDPSSWRDVRAAGLFGAADLTALLGLGAKAGIRGPVEWSTTGSNIANNNDGTTAKPGHGEYDNPYDTTNLLEGWSYDATYTQSGTDLREDRVYFMPECKGGGNKLTIDGEIENVTIVAQCKIEIASSAILKNVVLFAIPVEKAGENDFNAITVGEGAQIGDVDNCTGNGGVRMYTTKSVHAAANSKWVEAQIVARYNIDFAGQSDSVQGLSAHAGRKIKIQSNAVIGGLQNDTYVGNPTETSCIEDGVSLEWTKYDFSYPIVD